MQAVRRVDPTFRLTVANAGDILRICQMAGGMPLALELAAPWISVMDCAAIAEAIQRNLDLLVTTARDVPDRQRSIEGVFAQTWTLLPLNERDTLARLSVFRGPFDLDAAMQVAGASTVELAILLSRALLHRRANGRYDLHDLLRQFAQSATITSDSSPVLSQSFTVRIHALQSTRCFHISPVSSRRGPGRLSTDSRAR